MSYFNWWNFGLCSGLILGVTVIVYVQDHINWEAADLILNAVMATSLVIFIMGRRFYRYRKLTGSPLTPMLRVLVAAFAKRNLPHPSSSSELYEAPKSEKSQGRLLCHTEPLKFLDKAAIIERYGQPNDLVDKEHNNPWRLSTVTQVEEVKLILNMVPIWLACLPFGMCVAQSSTFFIKQGSMLDRTIVNRFQIPPAATYSISAVAMVVSVVLYDKVLIPALRRATGNERGINILQRIGIGMAFSVLAMVVAALVERKRLNVVRDDPVKGSLSMSIFWLVPQFAILGFGDGFSLVGLQEYFYDQVPDSMRGLGIAFYLSVVGAANFLSSFLFTEIEKLTRHGNGRSWIGKNLNSSRIDMLYWILAGMEAVDICIFVILARRYSYKSVQRSLT